jgi:uncharacterized protein (TIGR04255 family)
MVLDLPPPSFRFLPRSPLELVVCQVRHEERRIEPHVALAIQEALGGPDGDFGRIEQVELHSAVLAVAAGGSVPPVSEVAHGWHLKTTDGGWTVALLPDHVSLETTRYTTWSDFHPRLEATIRAVESVASPTMEQRLGLRYVDRLRGLPVDSPADWSRWIQPSVLGPALHDVLGQAVTSSRQQIDLDLGHGRVCVLRHGMVRDPDGNPSYLLDFDVYRQQARRFSANDLVKAVDEFHQTADSLFEQVITSELLAYLAEEHNV